MATTTDGSSTGAATRPRGVSTPSREDLILRYYTGLLEELRGPLNALAGWVELLALTATSSDAADAERSAGIVLDRLRRLCADGRDSAAVALGTLALRTQRVDLAAVAGRVAASVAPARLDCSGPLEVDGDRDRLGHVIATALSATAAYGPVEATLRPAAGWALLTVTNERPVPFDVFQGLFSPFSRPPGAGDAVGLFVARAVVEAHGGHIGVTPEPDGRTSLWVRLPLR